MDAEATRSQNRREYQFDANIDQCSKPASELDDNMLHDTHETTRTILSESTEFVPLDFQQLPLISQRHKKKFGAPLCENIRASLCTDCRAYRQKFPEHSNGALHELLFFLYDAVLWYHFRL